MQVHEINIEEQKTFDDVGVFPYVLSPVAADNSMDQVCLYFVLF